MALRALPERLLGKSLSRLYVRAFSASPELKTADQLLSDGDLQSLLKRHSKEEKDVVEDKQVKLELMAHFARRTGRPVASNALGEMNSAQDMANWYAKAVRQPRARPHARRLIAAALEDPDGTIEDRIDLETEMVRKELMASLPSNLELDAKTFREPSKRSVRQKKPFLRPYIDQRNAARGRKAQIEEARRAAAGL